MKSTFEINGVNIRLDQIKLIDPIQLQIHNLDGFTAIFLKSCNLNNQSQYSFDIWFVGKNGGYRTFRSKVVDYKGSDNFKGDDKFKAKYNSFVDAWKQYHDEQKIIAE